MFKPGDQVIIKSTSEVLLPPNGTIVCHIPEFKHEVYVVQLCAPYYGLTYVNLNVDLLRKQK